ncbi:MAG: hypothetical protein HC922_06205 [Leptolyngbyaceae cyanobacterium SM2_3_12]|nr:hypothetical protein [Leptolyngbyaceae cyanobacterium SM2_3_12]
MPTALSTTPGQAEMPRYVSATVTDTIYPHQPGRVKYQGTWWRAVCNDGITVLPTTPVAVTGRVGLTLIVQTVGPAPVVEASAYPA